jgi:hypothetical protein
MNKHLEPRRVGTKQKAVWLTEESQAAVQQWADENQTTFSAAIETLARLGLGEAPATAMMPILLATVRSSVATQFERLAKLLSAAAIDSGVAARLAGATARLMIQDRAAERPADFEDTIFTEDPDDLLDQRIRESWEELKALARRESVKSLKTPLRRLASGEVVLFDDDDEQDAEDEEAQAASQANKAPGSRLPAAGGSHGRR